MACSALVPWELCRIHTCRETIHKRTLHHPSNLFTGITCTICTNLSIAITTMSTTKVNINTVVIAFASPVQKHCRNLHGWAFAKTTHRIFRRRVRTAIALNPVRRIDPSGIVSVHQRIKIDQSFNIVTFTDNTCHIVLFKTKALLKVNFPISGMLIVYAFEPTASVLGERRHSHDIVIRINNKRSRSILPRA